MRWEDYAVGGPRCERRTIVRAETDFCGRAASPLITRPRRDAWLRSAPPVDTAACIRYEQDCVSDLKPSSPEVAADISQWCLPPVRQQAGSEDGLPCASGASNGVIRTANTAMDAIRLMNMRILARRAFV